MSAVHPIFYLIFAEILQLAVLVLQRDHNWSFIKILPVICLFMYLFMAAYTSDRWTFSAAWFMGTAICAIGSLCLSVIYWKEPMSLAQGSGIACILIGAILVGIK